MNFAKATLPRRRQRRLNFGGMVAVIVDHTHSGCAPAQLKTPVNATELIKPGPDCFHFNIKADTDRNRRSSIQNVVHSRYMQGKLAQIFLAITHAKAAQWLALNSQARGRTIFQLDQKIRPTLSPIGHRAALHLRQQSPQQRIIVARHYHSVKRHAIHELQKCFLHIPHVAVAIHVLAVDVGHNGENRRKLQK